MGCSLFVIFGILPEFAFRRFLEKFPWPGAVGCPPAIRIASAGSAAVDALPGN
jgi:hypothetical protein